jgi:hypothetical protein
VHPLAGHVLLVVYSVQERGVPVHAAVSYQEQPAARQAALVVLVEQALGMPKHDPLGLPQAHSCSARQVARVDLAKHGLAVVKQTTSHEHPVCAKQVDWL